MLRNNPQRPRNELPSTRLKRQLSIFYRGPDGRITSDDPDSYKGQERVAYQEAILSQHPRTGYADGILKERKQRNKTQFFSIAKKEESENEPSVPTPP
ncbi:hypothetical protein [Legionella sp. PC997]|uniref:hypothetical protein n=1 Tax=Legionella sp. PC997 TaxID=2755562 RepID=UPI0015FC46D0|nr:hypothetical protein [Legionella sp. PC997]QMT61849.1 hypothetical protein HBNCFIEN_03256 [Legionella sp. PC997]